MKTILPMHGGPIEWAAIWPGLMLGIGAALFVVLFASAFSSMGIRRTSTDAPSLPRRRNRRRRRQ